MITTSMSPASCLILMSAAIQWAAGVAFGQGDPAARAISEGLKSTNAVVVAQAVADAKKYMRAPQNRHVVNGQWVPLLMSAHRYDEAIDLAQAAILRHAGTLILTPLQKAKIRALLIIGRNDEAVSEAKAYYNVCPLTETREAIDLLCECLAAAHPDDPGIAERLRQEQARGAAAPPEGTTAATAARSPTLDAIKVDPRPYEEALRAGPTGDPHGRANLLLMVGRVSEARDCFEKISASGVTDRQHGPAPVASGLARCMKAEDGTTGRAEAWLKKQSESK